MFCYEALAGWMDSVPERSHGTALYMYRVVPSVACRWKGFSKERISKLFPAKRQAGVSLVSRLGVVRFLFVPTSWNKFSQQLDYLHCFVSDSAHYFVNLVVVFFTPYHFRHKSHSLAAA